LLEAEMPAERRFELITLQSTQKTAATMSGKGIAKFLMEG